MGGQSLNTTDVHSLRVTQELPPPPPLSVPISLHSQKDIYYTAGQHSERNSIYAIAMRHKIQFLNWFTYLFLEITYRDSHISFDKNCMGFTLQIGDHFFLVLSVCCVQSSGEVPLPEL